MTVKHVLLIEWADDVTDSQIQQCRDGLHALKDAIPGIQDVAEGKNFSERGGDTAHAVVMTMDDKAALEGYAPHPAHLEFVAMAKPWLKKLTVIDFEA